MHPGRYSRASSPGLTEHPAGQSNSRGVSGNAPPSSRSAASHPTAARPPQLGHDSQVTRSLTVDSLRAGDISRRHDARTTHVGAVALVLGPIVDAAKVVHRPLIGRRSFRLCGRGVRLVPYGIACRWSHGTPPAASGRNGAVCCRLRFDCAGRRAQVNGGAGPGRNECEVPRRRRS